MIQERTGTYQAAPESEDWIEMRTHSESGIETAETGEGFQRIGLWRWILNEEPNFNIYSNG